MSSTTTAERLALKPPEAAFLNVLEREFHFSPRVADEVLNAARETLDGRPPASARAKSGWWWRAWMRPLARPWWLAPSWK